MPIEYAYVTLCSFYAVLWIVFFILSPETRREQWIVTVCALPLGFTEYFYYDYFRPVFLFPLLPRIGLEDFLWAGLVSGIGAVAYTTLSNQRTYRDTHTDPGIRGYVWLFISLAVGISFLGFGTTSWGINSVYISIGGFLFLTGMSIWWRSDLITNAYMSGGILVVLTLLVYAVWLFIYPNAFAQFWQLHNISGIFFGPIPLEELVYVFAWGSFIGPLYELMRGFRMKRAST